jgi:hypothetical protein
MKCLKETLLHNTTVYWKQYITCSLNITVTLQLYEKYGEYYDIKYVWDYDRSDPQNHPLYYDMSFLRDHYDGDRLFRNRISDALVTGLVMDDIELEKEAGSITAEEYRISIMKSVADLDD